MDVGDSLPVNGSDVPPPCELGIENETLFCLDQPQPSKGRQQTVILIQKTIKWREKSAKARLLEKIQPSLQETRLDRVICSEVWIRDQKAELSQILSVFALGRGGINSPGLGGTKAVGGGAGVSQEGTTSKYGIPNLPAEQKRCCHSLAVAFSWGKSGVKKWFDNA